MPLGIPLAVHNYSLQFREADWVLYVQPTWYMQLLTDSLYFPQSAHFCVSIWCHAECDEASGGCSVNRIRLLPAQQACSCVLPARGMTLHVTNHEFSPRPAQNLWVDFLGALTNPLLVLIRLQTPDGPSDSCLLLWKTFLHGVQRRTDLMVSKIYVFV